MIYIVMRIKVYVGVCNCEAGAKKGIRQPMCIGLYVYIPCRPIHMGCLIPFLAAASHSVRVFKRRRSPFVSTSFFVCRHYSALATYTAITLIDSSGFEDDNTPSTECSLMIIEYFKSTEQRYKIDKAPSCTMRTDVAFGSIRRGSVELWESRMIAVLLSRGQPKALPLIRFKVGYF